MGSRDVRSRSRNLRDPSRSVRRHGHRMDVFAGRLGGGLLVRRFGRVRRRDRNGGARIRRPDGFVPTGSHRRHARLAERGGRRRNRDGDRHGVRRGGRNDLHAILDRDRRARNGGLRRLDPVGAVEHRLPRRRLRHAARTGRGGRLLSAARRARFLDRRGRRHARGGRTRFLGRLRDGVERRRRRLRPQRVDGPCGLPSGGRGPRVPRAGGRREHELVRNGEVALPLRSDRHGRVSGRRRRRGHGPARQGQDDHARRRRDGRRGLRRLGRVGARLRQNLFQGGQPCADIRHRGGPDSSGSPGSPAPT